MSKGTIIQITCWYQFPIKKEGDVPEKAALQAAVQCAANAKLDCASNVITFFIPKHFNILYQFFYTIPQNKII